MQFISRDWWRLVPFAEARRDLDLATWSRVETGVELGMQPFKGFVPPFSWFYVGQGLHQAWVSPGRDRPEWEIRTLFDVPVSFLKVRSKPLGLYALNEYTYDLRGGAGIRNEMAAGIKIPLPFPHFLVLLGWRHVDLVHKADVDQFEGSLEFEF